MLQGEEREKEKKKKTKQEAHVKRGRECERDSCSCIIERLSDALVQTVARMTFHDEMN